MQGQVHQMLLLCARAAARGLRGANQCVRVYVVCRRGGCVTGAWLEGGGRGAQGGQAVQRRARGFGKVASSVPVTGC